MREKQLLYSCSVAANDLGLAVYNEIVIQHAVSKVDALASAGLLSAYQVRESYSGRERESMSDTKERTCEERINSSMEDLEESLVEVLEHYNDGDNNGVWNNYPLAVTDYQVTKIEFSWGGPSDFLKVFHDGTEIYSVEYHFQDWFDGAMRKVEEGTNIWKYAQTVIDCREGGM